MLVKSVGKLKLMREGLRALCDVRLVSLIACKGLVEFCMHTFETICQISLCRELRLLEVIFCVIEALQTIQKDQVVDLT
jgi:hypothetical protein